MPEKCPRGPCQRSSPAWSASSPVFDADAHSRPVIERNPINPESSLENISVARLSDALAKYRDPTFLIPDRKPGKPVRKSNSRFATREAPLAPGRRIGRVDRVDRSRRSKRLSIVTSRGIAPVISDACGRARTLTRRARAA